MAINWSQLSPIPAGHVEAQLPSIPPSNSADSLASGIMSGLQQGSALQTQALQRDQTRQAMSQSAQMFPSQLATSQANAQHNQILVKQDLRTEAGVEAFKQNASQGYVKAQQAMMAADPVGGVAMGQNLADLQKRQADAASAMTDSKTKQTALLSELQVTVANAVQTATSAATDPKTGQVDWTKANAVYQQILDPAKKNTPDIINAFPDKLEPGAALNTLYIGQMAQAQMAQTYLAKNPQDTTTPDIKNAKRIADLQSKADSGSISTIEKIELEKLQESSQGAGINTLGKSQSLVDQLQTQYDKITDKTSPGAQRVQEKLQQAKDAVSKETSPGLIQGLMNKGSNMMFGSGNAVSLAPPNPELQQGQVSNSTPPATVGVTNTTPTQADIEYTAKIHGMTPDQVKAKLGVK